MKLLFNIFQVYQYFTIYRWYFLFLKHLKNCHEYLIQHTLKSGGTKDHFRQLKVPGTALIESLYDMHIYVCRLEIQVFTTISDIQTTHTEISNIQ
jgi:hypothetical protein